MQNYYYPTNAYYPFYREIPMYPDNDQRFFPFLLPAAFLAGGIAGLAISPWLFNRPFYQPYPYPTPYPTPYPYPVPSPTPYPASLGYAGTPALQPYSVPGMTTAPAMTTDNVNIYNH